MNSSTMPAGEVLASLAKKFLPSRSGQLTIFEVDLKVVLDNYKLIYLKVCFWRPNNYMLVGYEEVTEFDFQNGKLNITANHDSTWQYDGLSFMNKAYPELRPIEISIKDFGLKQIEEAEVNDETRTFTFKYTQASN